MDGIDEVGHVGHSLLQQVADRLRVGGQQLAGVALLDVLGQDEDRRPRSLLAELDGRAQALVACAWVACGRRR